MKSYLYNGKINEDFIRAVQSAFNENFDNEIPIVFFIESTGGYTDDKDAALFLLNIENKKRTVRLVAKNAIYSAAFDLFLGFDGGINILPDTFGMTHLSTFTETINSSGQSDDDKYLQSAKRIRNEEIQTRDYAFIEYLTAEEKDDYIQGKPIYFHTERTKEIILSERAKRGLA